MITQKGFSLIELLIVVTTLGIILSIAAPNFINSRRAANEASAVSSLRTIHTAQTAYLSTNGNDNYGTRDELLNTKLIDSVLGSGTKNNYTFPAFTVVAKTSTSSAYYFATSTPTITSGVFQTGFNSFAVSEAGVIHKRTGATAPTIDSTTRGFVTGSPLD
jgi:prepilin-type N-terminal cleavage/methylation domain-containing protein